MGARTKSQEDHKRGIMLNPDDLAEARELQRAVNFAALISDLVSKNTALVPEGQAVAKQWAAVTQLLQNQRQLWLSAKLNSLGFSKSTFVNIDFQTGLIREIDEPNAQP